MKNHTHEKYTDTDYEVLSIQRKIETALPNSTVRFGSLSIDRPTRTAIYIFTVTTQSHIPLKHFHSSVESVLSDEAHSINFIEGGLFTHIVISYII